MEDLNDHVTVHYYKNGDVWCYGFINIRGSTIRIHRQFAIPEEEEDKFVKTRAKLAQYFKECAEKFNKAAEFVSTNSEKYDIAQYTPL